MSNRGRWLPSLAWGIIALLIIAVSVEATLRISGRLLLISQDQTNESHRHKDCLGILTLGESTTADFNDANALSWPRQLEKMLRSQGFNVCVFNEARVAITSATLIRDTPEYLEKWKPSIVITMMGGNDAPHLYSELVYNESALFNLRLIKLFRALRIYLSQTKFIKPDPFDFANNVEIEAAVGAGDMGVIDLIKRNAERLPDNLSRARYLAHWGFKAIPRRGSAWSAHVLSYQLLQAAHAQDHRVESVARELAFQMQHFQKFDACLEFAKSMSLKERNIDDVTLTYFFICEQEMNDSSKWSGVFPSSTSGFEIDRERSESPTRAHYRFLARLLARESVHLIAMQYPRQNLEDLKDHFRDVPRDARPEISPEFSRVRFVSNEDNFERALVKFGWEKIFFDNYANKRKKPFGHGTEFGNQLIAEAARQAVEDILRATAASQ